MSSGGCPVRLRLEFLTQDKPRPADGEPADIGSLDLVVEGCHLYGLILKPDGSYGRSRPCVILLHGFPGVARNDDLAQAMRRIGCVVLTPHHRGAWGSEGKYLFSNCVEDAVRLAEYVRSPGFCREMGVDPDSIFLCGHSMGSNTALQAARRLPWLRGTILMTPYDPAYYLRTGREALFRELLKDGRLLRSDGLEALYEDAAAHQEDYSFPGAFEDMKDRNLCFVVGERDDTAPPEEMAEPLWNLLKDYETKAVQRYVSFDCGHCLCGVRFALAECVGMFLKDVLEGTVCTPAVRGGNMREKK